MTNATRPYDSYVETGVPWLGSIPSHWEVRRNGRLVEQRNDVDAPICPCWTCLCALA